MNFERKTESFKGKERDNRGPTQRAVPILMRSKTPTQAVPPLSPRVAEDPPLSPRRVRSAFGAASRQSPVIKQTLNPEVGDSLENESLLLHKRQVGTPTKHTVNMVFPHHPPEVNPDIQREKELGHYARRQYNPTEAFMKKRDDSSIMHKMTRKPAEDTFGDIFQTSRTTTPAVSPRAGGAVSPRAGGATSPRAGSAVSPRPGRHFPEKLYKDSCIIGTDPNTNLKSTPIYGAIKAGQSLHVILPSSMERYVDNKGNSILHKLSKQKETELRAATPTGRKHHHDPAGATKHVVDHVSPSPSAGRLQATRSLRYTPNMSGSAILGTTQRDASRPQGLHVQGGPPLFVPNEKPQSHHVSMIKRSGSSKRPDNDIFNRNTTAATNNTGGNNTSNSQNTSAFVSVERSRNTGKRINAYSPVRKTGEWQF